MAFSGSVDGSSGTEIRPAPRFFRVLREEVLADGREPRVPRLTGMEPVAVMAEELRVEPVEPAVALAITGAAVPDFVAAIPQALQ